MNDTGPATETRTRLTAGTLLFIAVLALAAGWTRFYALGDRPLHHDESIHAYQSYTLSKGGDWRYDPAYHGPFLYYVNALVYKIVGASDFTARLMPAVFGLLLIAFAWPLRRWIGKPAAAVYAVFVLTAPHFMYFSRFIREDLYSLVFTLGTILAFQRFLETDRSKWLMLSATAFALAGVTKENAYMTGVLFVAYGLWCLVRGLGTPDGPRPAAAARRSLFWTLGRLAPIMSAGILFLVIWAGMYSAFGKYPGDWLAIPKAIKYWMGQHSIARIPGPWYYYFPQLAFYDTAICFAALFAFSRRDWKSDPFLRCLRAAVLPLIAYLVLRRYVPLLAPHAIVWVAVILAAAIVLVLRRAPADAPTLTPFVQFVAFWAVGSLAIYGWAREKVPWLTVHPLLPLTLLAALGMARLWPQRGRPWAGLALGVTALLLCVNTSGAYLASFRYGAHDLEREPRHAELLAYVQTTRDLVRSLAPTEAAKARVPAGQPVVTVAGEGVWPLTWYLRDANVTWASRIEQASTPVIIADWDPEGAL
ncbi:MAG TPA: flippase activity-associated protein Agl23, partial [Thermoanaerobaculia bacterium]